MSISSELIDFSGASEFEIRNYVGSLGYKTIVDWEYYAKDVSPLAPTRTVEAAGPQIRLYDARCLTRTPALYNTRVMLKEFLPSGLELAVSEAEAYKRLYDANASAEARKSIPVARLLGQFLADQSFNGMSFELAWAKRFPRSPKAPRPGTPFLVFIWEGTTTAGAFPRAVAASDSPGGRFFESLWPAAAQNRTSAYLRMFMLRSLEALLFLHATGLVHRSVGTSSLLVNTVDNRFADSLDVKLKDFGFAKPVSELAAGVELERAKKAGASNPSEIASFFYAEDIYSLAYTFCELIFESHAAIQRNVPKPDASQDRFKATFEDTFEFDITRFREYCKAEDAWAGAVKFLDSNDGSGWDLLKAMLQARENYAEISLLALTKSAFFA